MKIRLPWGRSGKARGRNKGNRKLAATQPSGWRPHHLLMVVSVSALLGVLAVSLYMLQDPQRFPIRSVGLVQKDYRHLDVDVLEGLLQTFVGQGFFTVNVDAVRHRLQTLPWVDRVSVRRVWPDSLQVMVVEQWPLARWGRQVLINRRGELFTPRAASMPSGLAQLNGPDGLQHQVAGMYKGLSQTLAPLNLRVAKLSLDGRRAWSMRLDNGVEVELGRSEPHARVERFARIYPGLLAGRSSEFGYVDLRYTNGFAVRWKMLSKGGA